MCRISEEEKKGWNLLGFPAYPERIFNENIEKVLKESLRSYDAEVTKRAQRSKRDWQLRQASHFGFVPGRSFHVPIPGNYRLSNPGVSEASQAKAHY